ncbi:MAG: sugar ABC transporter ATP-binding protein [Isosphaeraceae bacterium]
MEPPPLLGIRGLAKSYASPVLRGLDLDLAPGSIHALIGANGAGKSTLARILSGLTAADEGSMTLAGSPYRPASKSVAAAMGVQIVTQEPQLIGTLSVAENLRLDRLPSAAGFVGFRRLNQGARPSLERVGLANLDPSTPAEQLGVGQRHLVMIASALERPCKLLILDEPTAALNDHQAERLFEVLRNLKAGGTTILYISHRLEEIRRLADRVSVLRDGRLVDTRPAGSLAVDEAVRLMVGADPVQAVAHAPREFGPMALRVDSLSRGDRVRDVSFEVRQGEVLGLFGLVGSGRTELLRAVFGADEADSGKVRLGEGPPRRFRSPRQAVRAGIGLIPEDRKVEGLLLPLSIRLNATLARLRPFVGPLGMLRDRAERRDVEELGRRVQLKYASADQPVEELSGGNQQKVLIGRWLLREPFVILFDEPTRGIDVAAKFVVYGLIEGRAREGAAVVVASSELDELMALCDRIAVMSAGRLVATFDRRDWSHEAILSAAFQEHIGPRSGTTGAES